MGSGVGARIIFDGPADTFVGRVRSTDRRDAVVSNSPTPFEEALLPHLDAAFTLARYLLDDEDEARDAVQDAYLRGLKYFRGFRGDDARAWILAIVRNVCHTRHRRRTALAMTPFDEEVHSPIDDVGDNVPLSTHHVSTAALRGALERLPFEYREVLILREVQGYSYKEIGAIAGIPIGTVMSRLGRARQRLREALRPPTRNRVST